MELPGPNETSMSEKPQQTQQNTIPQQIAQPQYAPQQQIPPQFAPQYMPQYAPQPTYAHNPYATPMPSPQAIARRNATVQMIQPQNLRLAVFAFFFCYFYAESVLSYNIHGIGVTLSTIIFCLFTFFTYYKNAAQKNTSALLLYCPIFMISLGFSLHFNPMSHLIMSATLFVLLGLQFVLFTCPAIKQPFSPDMLRLFFVQLVWKPLAYLTVPFKTLKFFKTVKSSGLKKAAIILLGLVVAVPACALLLMWFTSADAGFSALYQDAVAFLRKHIEPDVLKIFLNLLITTVVGAVLGAILILNSSKIEPEQADAQPQEKKTINTLFLSTFLSAITIVIALFVATQFKYFFFGAETGTVAAIGYAEYARRGFFELTYASAFIFVILVLTFTFCKKRVNGGLPRFIQVLLSVICASNIVILISAIMRMFLYIDVHGYSMKRLMTLWFMPILGICTLLLLIKCFAAKLNALKLAGITVVAAVCLLSIFNTDRFVAKQRVDRYLETGNAQDLDMEYFSQLSYSSLPEADRCFESAPISRAMIRRFKDQKLDEMKTYKSQDSIFAFTLDRLLIQP